MKIFHYLIHFLVLFAVGLAIYIFYLLFVPLKPVVFFNSPFPVKTPVIKQGEQLIYIVSHCKYIDTSAIVSRTLVDSIQYTLPEINVSVPKGCQTLNIMTVNIPKIIPPGIYHLSITVTYNLNPFRTYTVQAKTQDFQIIKE